MVIIVCVVAAAMTLIGAEMLATGLWHAVRGPNTLMEALYAFIGTCLIAAACGLFYLARP